MIYKIYTELSDYLIAPDGTAIDKATHQPVKFEKTQTGFTAKLITDEIPSSFQGKKKPVRLVRRFTREELVKMYNRSTESFDDAENHIDWKPKSSADNIGAIRDLGKVTGDEAKTVTNLPNDQYFEDGVVKTNNPSLYPEGSIVTQEMMDKLSASKRNVKSNPKTPKALKEKVSKAIKETDANKPLKFPYFNIDGINYQSARKASEALKVSVNTVLKRTKMNKDGWFYVESNPNEKGN